MSKCKVHNVRFYKPKPKAIYCMAINSLTRKLAVSRSDASIEIWNLMGVSFIERTIATTTENYSIEGLTWCGERLFSVGLHALLIEYDLQRLCIKNKASITGQTAFCLDTNKMNTHIAVGTEQGYINIFQVEQDGVSFEKFLDKQEGRILCLKYDESGQFLVSGSMDTIRIWNVKTGHAIHKMTTGRIQANKATIVWCLAVTQDFTIISGDSRGKITFWDGNVGAQIESYQSHKSDVLCICLNGNGKTLYAAGVDPNIISYDRINVKGESHKWVRSVRSHAHEHDVRAIVVDGAKILSGGVDGYLACINKPKNILHPPILQNPCSLTASQSRFVLLNFPKYIELWQLGDYEDNKILSDNYLALKHDSKKLLVLQRKVKSDLGEDKKEGVVTSAISKNGKWIVFGTSTVLRLYNFEYLNRVANCKPVLTMVENLPDDVGVSLKSAFTSNNEQLILVTPNGDLQVIKLGDIPTIQQTLETKLYLKDTITFLLCSPCNKYLIVADPQSNIAVWENGKDLWKFYCTLPKYSSPPTAINIQPKTLNIFIAYSDHKVVEFNLSKKKMTNFSKELDQIVINSTGINKHYPIKNITFDPRNDKVAILHDDSNIIVINKEKKIDGSAKIPKISLTEDAKPHQHGITAIKKYKHLVHLEWLTDDEMVVVEISPLTLISQLPPGYKQDVFGRK